MLNAERQLGVRKLLPNHRLPLHPGPGDLHLGERTEPHGALDANLSHNLTDNVSFILEGVNLLEGTDATRSILSDLPFDSFDPGRRIMVGARVRY